MNERIDQLLWAAGGFTKLNYPDDAFLDGRYALTQEQLDKFAELIVQEAAAFVSGAAEVYNQTEQDACVRASKGLKKYFGVKE